MSPHSVKSILNVEPPAPFRRRAAVYRIFIVFAMGVIALDQASKAWIVNHLPYGTYGQPGAIEVIPGFFNIVHVGNTGAAWSMLAGHSVLLAGVAAITLAAIFWWRRALGLKEPLAQIGFGLLCGGIVGNLIDRIVHGHVIDFLDFHFGSYVYPSFNVADSGICVGVALYLWHSFATESARRH